MHLKSKTCEIITLIFLKNINLFILIFIPAPQMIHPNLTIPVIKEHLQTYTLLPQSHR